MKTSFFLTPDLKDRAVNLAYRDAQRTLHPWANQLEIMEQDPTKGTLLWSWSSAGRSDLFPLSVRVLLGGIGLYSSMRDYLKLLRHLMQIHGNLVMYIITHFRR